MEGYILHTEDDSMENRRVAGAYGKHLLQSDKYTDLIQIVRDITDNPWSEILDYDPEGDFVTVNMEKSLSGSLSVTVSDGRVDRTARYYHTEMPEQEDNILFKEHVEEVLHEEDLDRLRETNGVAFQSFNRYKLI